MVRFIHFSDSHIGINPYRLFDSETGDNPRTIDFLNSLKSVVDSAVEERVDFVVHSGDLFDSLRVSTRAIRYCFEALRPLSDAEIPFYVIAGNHDRPQSITADSPVRLLSFLDHVYPISKLGSHAVRTTGDTTVVVHGISYVGEPLEYVPQRGKSLVQNTSGHYNILLLHQTIAEADAGGERTLMAWADEPKIPLRDLPEGFQYVGVGHVHKNQVLELPDNTAVRVALPGAGERVDFGEKNSNVGYFMVEEEAGELVPTYRPLPTRPMVELRLNFDRPSGEEVREALRVVFQEQDITGKLVGVRVTGELDLTLRRHFHPKHLKELGKEALHVTLLDRRANWHTRDGVVSLQEESQWMFPPEDELRMALEKREGLTENQRELLREKGLSIMREVEEG